MTCRERLERVFHELGVPYRVTPHHLAYTAQEVAMTERISGYDVAKVVIVMTDETPVMVVLPAPLRVNLEKVKRAFDAKTARLATEKEFTEFFPDCDIGAMPPFGNLYGVTVCVDRSLTFDPEITFNAGSHRETMTVAYADFERLVRPKIAEVSISAAREQSVMEPGIRR